MAIRTNQRNSKTPSSMADSKGARSCAGPKDIKEAPARKLSINVIDLDKELGSHAFVNGD